LAVCLNGLNESGLEELMLEERVDERLIDGKYAESCHGVPY